MNPDLFIDGSFAFCHAPEKSPPSRSMMMPSVSFSDGRYRVRNQVDYLVEDRSNHPAQVLHALRRLSIAGLMSDSQYCFTFWANS